MSKKISNEDLIKNLQELFIFLGRVPQKSDLIVGNNSKFGSSSYSRAFGNFANALIAAGLKPNQIRGLSKQEVLDDLKKTYELLGHTPQHIEYQTISNIGYSFPAIRTYFGSWTKALIAAGIPIIKSNKIDKQFVIDELKKWYTKNNCDVNCLSYWSLRKAKARGDFPFSCTTVRKHFSGISWQDIMRNIDTSYETKDHFIEKKHYIGNDQNEYLSLLELEAANYLFEAKNKNIIANYEYEARVCQERLWTCDFVITLNDGQKLWLELDGMRNNRKDPYKKYNEKIEFYKNNNFNYKIFSYNNRDIIKSLSLLFESGDFIIGDKVFNLKSKIDDDFVFFTKEEIYDYIIKNGQDELVINIIEPFYQFLLSYIDLNGWIFPERPNNYKEMLMELEQKGGVLSSSDRTANSFLKAHFKSFWLASFDKQSNPVSYIQNRDKIYPLLKYRFGLGNGKKYKYTFNSKVVEFNELFDISFKQIRKSLEVNRCAVSLFKPLVAKYIYKKYGFDGMSVWDPCAGFGGRLLGFLSAFEKGIYIGNEPNSQTHSELLNLIDSLNVKERAKLFSEPIEKATIQNVDMVFTCPPYGFKEHYCDEATQSDILYKTEKEWLDGFLLSLIKKSYLALPSNGYFIVVFDQKFGLECIRLAEENGFVLNEILNIENQRTHLNPTPNSEMCLIFNKK